MRSSNYDKLHDFALLQCKMITEKMKQSNIYVIKPFYLVDVAGSGFIAWEYEDNDVPPQYKTPGGDYRVCYPEVYHSVSADGRILNPPSEGELKMFKEFCETA